MNCLIRIFSLQKIVWVARAKMVDMKYIKLHMSKSQDILFLINSVSALKLSVEDKVCSLRCIEGTMDRQYKDLTKCQIVNDHRNNFL